MKPRVDLHSVHLISISTTYLHSTVHLFAWISRASLLCLSRLALGTRRRGVSVWIFPMRVHVACAYVAYRAKDVSTLLVCRVQLALPSTVICGQSPEIYVSFSV